MQETQNMRRVALPDGSTVPCLGQGTWYLGEKPERRAAECETLRWGAQNGMELIDTAEMYGDGKAEELVGEAIRPLRRESLFLVSKVYPWNAGRRNIFRACEDSLQRLGTDYLDLYLLHWRGNVPLRETVECLRELVRQGRIRRWGVSNFDRADMEELFSVTGGSECAVDQVLYHLGSRGVEHDLLPWLRRQHIPLMAYSPLAQAGTLRRGLAASPAVTQAAAAHGVSPYQVLLAFVLAQPGVFAIPRASALEHVQQNRAAADLTLSAAELAALDRAFPAPAHAVPLDMI